MTDSQKIEILYGAKVLKPVKYWIERGKDGFYLHSEFASLGPFESEADNSDSCFQ